MIGSLRGTVVERTGDSTVLLEVNGVGYLVTMTARALGELAVGSSIFLYVHHHIREDGQTLYGFVRRADLAAFDVLIATHGVGPSLALAVLATHSPAALVEIVAEGDTSALTLVPGVGKKTAERLLVELRGRLDLPVLPTSSGGPAIGGVTDTVREALAGLGYGAEEIRSALREVGGSADGVDAAGLLRAALAHLGAARAR